MPSLRMKAEPRGGRVETNLTESAKRKRRFTSSDSRLVTSFFNKSIMSFMNSNSPRWLLYRLVPLYID